MSIDQFLLSGDTTDLNYPEIRPSLDLNFARTKTLDSRITFTRVSGGSYVGADGLIKYAGVNEARFDHDPSTGESLGLLIEEARTNFALQSQSLDAGDSGSSTGWYAVVRSSISANIALSPDGTLTADKIIANTENNSHNLGNRTQNNTIICANPCTVSVFLKASGETKAWLFITEASTYARTSLTYLDLTGSGSSTTPINANGAGSSSSSITAYPNGWYRCILTTTLGGTDSRVEVRIGPSQSMSTNIYAGNDLDGILAWGLQIEQGSFLTSYIPTQASTRTRAVDNARIIGKNFSDFYNPIEGTLFCEVTPRGVLPAGATPYWELGNGGTSDLIWGGREAVNSQRFRLNSRVNSTVDVNLIGSDNLSFTSKSKISSAYKENDYALSSNNSPVILDTSNIVPKNINRLLIANFVFGFPAASITSRLTYYPKRLTNSQLQALTR